MITRVYFQSNNYNQDVIVGLKNNPRLCYVQFCTYLVGRNEHLYSPELHTCMCVRNIKPGSSCLGQNAYSYRAATGWH